MVRRVRCARSASWSSTSTSTSPPAAGSRIARSTEHDAVDVESGLDARPALDPDRVELAPPPAIVAAVRAGTDAATIGSPASTAPIRDGAEVERRWHAIDASATRGIPARPRRGAVPRPTPSARISATAAGRATISFDRRSRVVRTSAPVIVIRTSPATSSGPTSMRLHPSASAGGTATVTSAPAPPTVISVIGEKSPVG